MRAISFAGILALTVGGFLFLGGAAPGNQAATISPVPRVLHLDPAAGNPTEIFTGAPSTVTMRSGYMVLAPGKSVGKHSTHGNEEAVIVLRGSGELRISGGATFPLKAFDVAYNPPNVEHDVVNTGSDTLRYVWLVARASQR